MISTSSGPVPFQSFTYDPFIHLTQAAGPAGTVSYTYYGDGLKRKRMGPDGTTLYFYDGIRSIYEMDDAGAMTAQLDRDIFGNLLSRAEPNGSRRHLHTDGLGSTVVLSDEAGMFAATMFYDAWGQARSTSGTGHGKYRFTGAELDATSGLYHMGARFYDPSIGRWLSEDPIKAAGPSALNFYAYVSNNPLVYTDPSGLCDQQCLGDLNARRQELAKKTNNASDYIAAREIARSLEATLGRDAAFDVAGSYLGKIAAGVDPGTALQESLNEALHPVSAGPGTSMNKFVLRQLIMGLYYEAVVFYGVGAVSETIAFFFWDPAKRNEFVLHVAYSPFTNIGTALFVAGFSLDTKYFNGAVLNEFMRRMRR